MALKDKTKEFISSLKAGDMIAFRSQTSTHWAIYAGDDKVIHLTGEDEYHRDQSDNNERLFTIGGCTYTKASVKEEDFITVAGRFTTYESNSKDTEMMPDDPEEIVELAKLMVGNIYHDEKWSDSEKFATYCRYDLDCSLSKKEAVDYLDGDLHFQSKEISPLPKKVSTAAVLQADEPPCEKRNKRDEFITSHNREVLNELADGDLVTIHHPLYCHWAVYIGDSKIIHLSGDEPFTRHLRFKHMFTISGVPFSKGWIKEDDFLRVAHHNKANKNNEKDNIYTPKEPKEIIDTAKSMLGKIGYNLIWNNCEHFATSCRYGKGFSDQVTLCVCCAVVVAVTPVLAYMLKNSMYLTS